MATKKTKKTKKSKKVTKAPVKFDEGKIRFELIPVLPLEELAKVYTFGACKYDDWNWANPPGFKYSRVLGAMERHMNKWKKGIDKDPSNVFNGKPINHLASVAWCAFTLMHYQMAGLGIDDRYKVEEKKEKSKKSKKKKKVKNG
jgi:hypothetical protein